MSHSARLEYIHRDAIYLRDWKRTGRNQSIHDIQFMLSRRNSSHNHYSFIVIDSNAMRTRKPSRCQTRCKQTTELLCSQTTIQPLISQQESNRIVNVNTVVLLQPSVVDNILVSVSINVTPGITQEIQLHVDSWRFFDWSLLWGPLHRTALLRTWAAANIACIPAIFDCCCYPASQPSVNSAIKLLLAETKSAAHAFLPA